MLATGVPLCCSGLATSIIKAKRLISWGRGVGGLHIKHRFKYPRFIVGYRFCGLLWSRCKRTKGNGTSAIRRLLWQEIFTLKQSRMSDGWELVNILRPTIVIIRRCHLIWYIELLWLLNHKVCFQKRAISVNPLRSDDTEERKIYKSCTS